MCSAAGFLTAPSRSEYFCTVLSSQSEIGELSSRDDAVFQSNAFSPEFFLASLEERTWIPRVAVVRSGASTVGVVYGKERKLAGIATGLIYIDTTLGGVSATDRSLRPAILQSATTKLLRTRGVRGLRLAVPFHGTDLATLREISQTTSADFAFRNSHNHSSLRLPFKYDHFLESLGSQTRRNFRYYRRRFEASGGEYVDRLERHQLEQACSDLRTRSRIECRDSGIARALRMLSIAERPLAVGLRQQDGPWMSVLAGWIEEDRVVIFLQINRDAEYPKLSLSLVMRAFLVESLIASGVREILFWAGTGGPLGRYADEIPTAFVYLDRPALPWRVSRHLISSIAQKIPLELRPLTSWISPPPEPFDEVQPASPSAIPAAAEVEH